MTHTPEPSAQTTAAHAPPADAHAPAADPTPQPGPAPRTPTTTNIALIASFAALTAVCSLVAIPVSAVPVPITLQTFAVLLAGAVLGARRGALAMLLYLAVGLAGLPIFAQGLGGPAVFGRPSVGYLLAFPVAAFVVGLLVERYARRSWFLSAGVIAGACAVGSLVIYAVGVPVLAAMTTMSLREAFVFNLGFVPFDAIKLALAALVAASIHRAFPDLLPRR